MAIMSHPPFSDFDFFNDTAAFTPPPRRMSKNVPKNSAR
jgi:hypothetical protein